MHRDRFVIPFVILTALCAAPGLSHAQARPLVDGREWQASSPEQRRAYLVGVSNIISVGARYDSKRAAGADTFSLRAQKGLTGTTIEPAMQAIDAWYKAHPTGLEKPVLSVIWSELSKPDVK